MFIGVSDAVIQPPLILTIPAAKENPFCAWFFLLGFFVETRSEASYLFGRAGFGSGWRPGR
jgi:hypothetical protein